MAIYKLYPVDHTPMKWQSSLYRGEAIVRADNEEHARQLGTNEFTITRPIHRGKKKTSPWEDPQTVLCQPLSNAGYDDNGPKQVLSPRLPGQKSQARKARPEKPGQKSQARKPKERHNTLWTLPVKKS
ncbi:hypothetical protein [Endozoicomonas sp.]|uniref:hypothetical protein n=1 Tax=Endozoicomonas sp. TaxID=1892382 RepID=UPI002883A637|nr:hypothetical protein [Endozoicomonas sp.]